MHNTKIDKTKLSNIPVISIDNMNELREKSILIKDKKGQCYVTASGQTFTRLHIKDDVVDQYIVGQSNLHKPYTKMELSVHGSSGNLQCNTVNQTYDQMLQTQGHLLQKYGIVTDSTNAKVSYIEINRTFELDGRFKDYKRVLLLLMSRLPKCKGVQIDFKNLTDDAYVIDEYVASNKSSSIKAYNKSSQLKMEVEKDIMRVEITLKKAQAVKRAFGTNRLEDLTDQIIDQYFIAQMKKLFVDATARWKSEREKKILKLMKQMKETEHHWISAVLGSLQNEEVLTGIPAMLDVNELIDLVDQVVIAKRKARTKEQFRRQADRIYTAFSQGDDIKLEELLDKLSTTSMI